MPALLRPIAFVTALGLALAPVGCQTQEPRTALSYTANAKKAYEEAMEEFKARNWIEAQTKMREVRRKYSYSRYARLAELRIADADFEQDKFAEAMRGYRQFVHDHRADTEDVSYARARIAEAEYRQISDSLLLPSASERDQASVVDAYKELRGYLNDYPDAAESRRARELLSDVTARLMRHELYVARFYIARANYDAAVSRIQHALRNYGEPTEGSEAAGAQASGLEPEALLLLGETYLKMHKWTDARDAFTTLLRRYPTSGLTVPARGYLETMRVRGV